MRHVTPQGEGASEVTAVEVEARDTERVAAAGASARRSWLTWAGGDEVGAWGEKV